MIARHWLALGVAAIVFVGCRSKAPPPSSPSPVPPTTAPTIVPATYVPVKAPALAEQRREFLSQELITARPFTYIFNVGQPPRIVWRDLERVRQLGASGRLHVRWFDADLSERAAPDHPGRWGAYVEGIAPNKTPLRRAMTFYARPPGFFLLWPRELPPPLEPLGGPIAADVWREHRDEIAQVFGPTLATLNDTPSAVVLIAGLSESKAHGRAPLGAETAAVLDDEFHLAIKLKAQRLTGKVHPLPTPRKRSTSAPVLHEGSPQDAGVASDAHEKIAAVCRAWADDSGEPFVTFVARRGVIVIHEAFGRDKNNQPIGLDYRADVASITKTSTALMFTRFLDANLLGLDDSVAKIFANYPKNSSHVPTFRQCFTHTSGLSGHGDFGGARNPHFENVVLNGIDVNEPGRTYTYSGMGFDLAAKAMEIVSGKSMVRLYHEDLFRPLGMGEVPMMFASSGAQFTARQLGILAQLLSNRGSYGEVEMFSEATFEKLLPRPVKVRENPPGEDEGIGMHWVRPTRSGKPAAATQPSDLFFSSRTIGHGSLTGCTFMIDLEKDLVIVQVRRSQEARFGEWTPKFFGAIADAVR